MQRESTNYSAFYFKTNDAFSGTLEIITMDGVTILQTNITEQSIVDVSKFVSGIYLVKIFNETGQISVSKLVIKTQQGQE